MKACLMTMVIFLILIHKTSGIHLGQSLSRKVPSEGAPSLHVLRYGEQVHQQCIDSVELSHGRDDVCLQTPKVLEE
ncbi:beta-defensin 125 isoform X3 [Lemur catta]|uniref:beta-defensin 125 isoform X3 n=1 Tax=Lemur catta TaxID=9447 RepID=UPI001E26D953|nr:beta-defensin 125 isoform X3 [Lemur catta]